MKFHRYPDTHYMPRYWHTLVAVRDTVHLRNRDTFVIWRSLYEVPRDIQILIICPGTDTHWLQFVTQRMSKLECSVYYRECAWRERLPSFLSCMCLYFTTEKYVNRVKSWEICHMSTYIYIYIPPVTYTHAYTFLFLHLYVYISLLRYRYAYTSFSFFHVYILLARDTWTKFQSVRDMYIYPYIYLCLNIYLYLSVHLYL